MSSKFGKYSDFYKTVLMMMHDKLYKFMFESAPVRGEIVSIQAAWQHILSLHQYPTPVANLLGEMLAAAALLSSTLKFDGALIIQIFGDGPVKLMVAEANSDLGLRATAKLAPSASIAPDANLQSMINVHGQARMSITLDPREKLPGQQPYQGIVPVENDSMAQILEQYMLRSEQLDTKLWLACDSRSSAGLIMQRMPVEGGNTAQIQQDQENWHHLLQLSATVKREELLELPPQEVVARLFWNENARIFEPRHTRFFCTCSRDRVANMLRTLGQDELDSIITDMGSVQVQCEYCNTAYEFDTVDVRQLFTAGELLPNPGKNLH
jgi:molecular chaperone Hsp33